VLADVGDCELALFREEGGFAHGEPLLHLDGVAGGMGEAGIE
jgi:hypothetical protein